MVGRKQKRDADTRLAQSRLSVQDLAKEPGDVAEARRQRGLDRTSFYERKRRFQTQGFEGRKDLPPVRKSHPQTKPPETMERIRALAHPAYGRNGFKATLALEGVPTDNGREFCGTEDHPCEIYLDLNGIEHRRTKVRTPRTNGFVERFNGTVLSEFFRAKMRETFYDSVEALQADLDQWLHHYNTERPHLGRRNMGGRPVETVMSFVSQESLVDSLVAHAPYRRSIQHIQNHTI